jgi:hypothetical protein
MTEQHANPGKTGPPNYMAVYDEIRGEWLSRAASEAELATKLLEKMTAARSIYDAMGAYQEWMSGRMDRFEEDNSRLWGQTQKAVEAIRNLALGSPVDRPVSIADTPGPRSRG